MSNSSIIKLELKNKKIITGKVESYENNVVELIDAWFLNEENIKYRIFIQDKDINRIFESKGEDERIIKMPDNIKDWNQFEANERLFGVKPEFNESDYTIVLDKKSEFYLKNLTQAKKIEHDILTSKCSDKHRMEDREHVMLDNDEDRYSAVLYNRKGHKDSKGKKDERTTGTINGAENKGCIETVEKKTGKEHEKSLNKKDCGQIYVKKTVKNDIAVNANKCDEKSTDSKENNDKVPEIRSVKEASETIQTTMPNHEVKGPVLLKGVSYKRSVSNTFKNIREYIENITSKFTGSLTSTGKWGTGDSYRMINDEKSIKSFFGRKR